MSKEMKWRTIGDILYDRGSKAWPPRGSAQIQLFKILVPSPQHRRKPGSAVEEGDLHLQEELW